ncbi:RNA polymerase sigma factor [bacterium]|nr:RNA polymerase sigma factor [bacterium]
MLQLPRRPDNTEDPIDLESIYIEYFPKIWRYMNYRIGPGEAEDLAADVLTRVIKNVDRRRGPLKTWIYRIAHNLAVDHLKSARVRREIVVDPQAPLHKEPSTDARSHIALRIDLLRALGQLTDDQREIITMKFFLGLDNDEIHTVTGRKPEAIRGLQFRALGALKKILQEEQATE